MTQDELIEMMNSDVAIGIKEWIQLRDHYLQCTHEFLKWVIDYLISQNTSNS
ncbi:Uncharacterised protein [Streptococcus acidominimus]|uniref:Uncharacterized protein n=1 Tax=Streptococcus acidominimus TaxID=1326 RepID=A0A380JLU3_STRAI|nr:hypothetical protein [Streptococcus acidominimus]SUN41238.1 Uncharacterised protein [Streptococcus acidominimus]